MEAQTLLAAVFVAGMFSGVFVIFLAMRQRAEVLQMQHRERMAMIERGQVPINDVAGRRPGSSAAASRSMSLGIIVIGLGLALMTVVSVAGDAPAAGIGIGGAIVILGAAFIVRSLVVKAMPPASSFPPPLDVPRIE
jgi:hypothetical protein